VALIRESKLVPLSNTASLHLTLTLGNTTRTRYDAKVRRFAESFQKAWRRLPIRQRRVIVRWLRNSVRNVCYAASRKGPPLGIEAGKSIPIDLSPTRNVVVFVEVGTGKRPYRYGRCVAQTSRFGGIWFSAMTMNAPDPVLLNFQIHELLHFYCWGQWDIPDDGSENHSLSETHIFIREELDRMIPGVEETTDAWLESRRRSHFDKRKS